MFASSPPSAPRISTMTFLPSFGSFGISSSLSSVSSSAAAALLVLELGLGGTRASRRRSRPRASRWPRPGPASVLPVLPVRVDDRAQLGDPPPRFRGRALVARRVELGELRLELLQLGLEVDQTFEHGTQGTEAVPSATAPSRGAARHARSRPAADCSANLSSQAWKSSEPDRSAIARGIAGNVVVRRSAAAGGPTPACAPSPAR